MAFGNFAVSRGIVGSGLGGTAKRNKRAQAPPMPASSPSGVAASPKLPATVMATDIAAADKDVEPIKTHPAITALIKRIRNKQLRFDPSEAGFVKNGKAEIQIWLNDKSAANLDQLKQLGFEIVLDPKSSKLLIGRISVEKLEALSKLEFVRYISPQSLK